MSDKQWMMGELAKYVSTAEGCLEDVHGLLDDDDDPLRRLLEAVLGLTGHIYGALCDRANNRGV